MPHPCSAPHLQRPSTAPLPALGLHHGDPMRTETCVATLCLVSSLLLSAPTQADTLRIDETFVRGVSALGLRAEIKKQTQVDALHGRHIIDMASLRMFLTPRLMIRAAVGQARVLCEPGQNGRAVGGAMRIGLVEEGSLSLGLELSAVHVGYEAGPELDDARVLVTLVTK